MVSKLFIKQTYPFQIYDSNINKTISFREVDFDRDVKLLHSWMNENHVVPYWKLDLSLTDYGIHLRNFLNDEHQTLLIGEIDGVPISYWESYWVKGDIIENYYEFNEYDQGVHLLIGDKDYLGKGLIYPLLMTILSQKFQVSLTEKVIAEPDVRNEKMIHVFKKCGFTPIKEVELPDKTGLLMFCERSTFERRWTDWQ
ncbi:acetyltransferase [Metabacillus litoralis]|uniref:Lysine N-acyltransferase MbtK n=2 Tax=Metabacillus TaxID=2675233 RepID=A0A179T2Y4_9BACI|nr:MULTISPECIES: GNAT family N-acetyltransferase [Metabacillus]OAS86812.1 acetyltransferase [Metabacillus litoralis]QNF29118.1 acetyltransferase [Metabacillus sp. KUDC1714]